MGSITGSLWLIMRTHYWLGWEGMRKAHGRQLGRRRTLSTLSAIITPTGNKMKRSVAAHNDKNTTDWGRQKDCSVLIYHQFGLLA